MVLDGKECDVEAISNDMSDIKETTANLDDIGLEIETSEIVKRQHVRPFDHFGSDRISE